MLPDFVQVKQRVHELLMHFMQGRVRHHLGFMSQVPRVVIPEGQHNRLVRSDGSVDDTKLRRIQGSEEISTDPKKGLHFDEVLQKLDAIAKQMADEQQRQMFARINEVTEKTGNVTKAPLKDFGLKHLNDMLEKMQIDFDEKGEPRLPSMVCGPKMADSIMARREEIEADVGEKARKAEILDLKKEEFRARESRRRLVE